MNKVSSLFPLLFLFASVGALPQMEGIRPTGQPPEDRSQKRLRPITELTEEEAFDCAGNGYRDYEKIAIAFPIKTIMSSSGYVELLEKYGKTCDLDDQDLSDAERHACGALKSLIDAETDKSVALSEHTVAVFRRHGIATNIILGLVVLVVVSGIILAAYQLWAAVVQGQSQGNNEIEATTLKLRITSSSVGIIVLALSILFLYLYVKEVYPISVISIGQ